MKAFVDYYASTASDRNWTGVVAEPYASVLPGVKVWRGGATGWFNPGVLRRLRQVTADVVVVSDYSAPSSQLAIRALTSARRPWIFWGEIPGVNARGPVGLWMRRLLQAPLDRAAGIAAIGSRAAATYRMLFPHVPVYDIPYFCDLEPFSRAAAARAPADNGAIRVLFSGQLIRRKGVDLLVEAFGDAARQARGLELRILGEGPMRAELERMAASAPGRITFLGHRDPPRLPAVFADADVFVLPSRHDGWGVVVNEALGAGLPIVVSDGVSAADDLVTHGVNGLVTPAGDMGALRDALVFLAREPGARNAMAEASRARAASWGLDEAVRRWQEACVQVLGNRAENRCTAEGRPA